MLMDVLEELNFDCANMNQPAQTFRPVASLVVVLLLAAQSSLTNRDVKHKDANFKFIHLTVPPWRYEDLTASSCN